MLITHLQLEGLRHAPAEPLTDLGPRVHVGDAPGRVAVADALLLWRAALDGSAALDVARALQLTGPEVEAHGTGADIEQLTGLDPVAVEALVDEGRNVRVTGSVQLDPVLYGQLREGAVRDPRVVTALSQAAELQVTTGWLFTSDLTAAAPSVLSVRVGDVAFATTGKEKPVWLPELLRALGGRVARVDLASGASGLADRLHEASLSPDARVRAGYARVVEAVQQAPFDLPAPGLLRSGDGQLQIAFGPELIRARQLGRHATDALQLAEVALVITPDVLVCTEPVDEPVAAWLEGCTAGDDATLEQVFVP